MERKRRSQILLAVLVVVLAALVYREWPTTTGVSTAPSNGSRGNQAAGAVAQPAAPDVHLSVLEGERAKPADTDRNLFRFRPKPAPPPPAPVPTAPPRPVVTPPAGPPPAPALPPIALKFMGIIEAPERGLKIAALSDQYGVYYGKEGDTILGQYKILRIGEESIDVAYLDGRGRQTIRLSGL